MNEEPRWADIWPRPAPPQCPQDSPSTGQRCLRLRGHMGVHEAKNGTRWASNAIEKGTNNAK